MKKIVLFLPCITLALFASCNLNVDGQNGTTDGFAETLTEEELKTQLFDKECNNSSTYIDGSLSYKPSYKGLLSSKVDGIKLEFNFSNSATLATIKDLEIGLKFTSKTGTVVVRDQVTIYEFIKPGKSIKYSAEIDVTNQQWKDIDDVVWTIDGSSCK